MLAGVWARLANWSAVFGGGPPGAPPLLVPADTHYYLRFAALQLESFPRFTSFDPWVNFPEGAFITWPPLHTWLVALALAATSPAKWELAAAWVGPAISCVELVAAAWLCRRVAGRPGLLALAMVALTPVAVEAGALGQADHHVHEPFLALAIPLLQLEALRSKRLGWAVACGALLGAGRLLSSMAFGLVPPVALAFAVVGAKDRAALRAGAVAGTSALGVSLFGVAAFGRLGSTNYVDHTAFNPLLVAGSFGAALGGALLFHVELRRWAAAGLAVAAASGALLAGEVFRALSHLLRDDPLLSYVDESSTLFSDPAWSVRMLSATPGLWALGCLGLWRLWKAGDRYVASVAVTAAAVAFAAVNQVRFLQAMTGAMAACAVGAAAWGGLSPRARTALWGAAALGCAVLAATLAPKGTPDDAFKDVRPVMEWIRDHTPEPGTPPAYAVLGNEDLGHVINLWARRPAVASTFSQAPWHVEGNARAHRFYLAPDEAQAYAAAVATRARYVVTFPMKKDAFGKALHESPAGVGRFRLVHDGPAKKARVFEVLGAPSR